MIGISDYNSSLTYLRYIGKSTVLWGSNPQEALKNILGLQSKHLLTTSFTENPPKIMLCTTPILAQDNIYTILSGIIGIYIIAMSPFFN